MLKRLRNLWYLSGLDLDYKQPKRLKELLAHILPNTKATIIETRDIKQILDDIQL